MKTPLTRTEQLALEIKLEEKAKRALAKYLETAYKSYSKADAKAKAQDIMDTIHNGDI